MLICNAMGSTLKIPQMAIASRQSNIKILFEAGFGTVEFLMEIVIR
jgi:hypothetical protein